MVDIETMGNSSRSAILSIGAVKFEPREFGWKGPEFYTRVNLASCLSAGLEMHASTVLWWMGQNDEARQTLLSKEDELPLKEALNAFRHFYTGSAFLWSHGATFDAVILTEAIHLVGELVPWSFRDVRDTRTLFDLSGPIDLSQLPKVEGVKHHALYDAKVQALMVQQAHRQLGKAA